DEQTGQRIEVKFSTVQQKAKRAVTDETVFKCIEDAIAEREPVLFSGWRNNRFDCNIQQVKRREFDVLYYGLFFADCVQIFRIKSSDIRTRAEGGDIGYSDRQQNSILSSVFPSGSASFQPSNRDFGNDWVNVHRLAPTPKNLVLKNRRAVLREEVQRQLVHVRPRLNDEL